jgi:hypothetical protein
MADALISTEYVGSIMTGLDGITTAILWILGMAVVGGLAWLFTYAMSFKIDCVVEEMVDGTAVVRRDKIRLFKEKGIPKWQLWGSLFKFKKDKIGIPDQAFIKLQPGGRKFVTLFKTPTGDHLIVRNSKDLEAKIADYDEFTTTQRAMILQEYREAMAYKPTDWMQHVPMLAGLTALVIIVVCFMLFFNDAVNPIVNTGFKYMDALEKHDDKIMQIAQTQQQTTEVLARILSNIDPAYLQELKVRAAQAALNGSNNTAYVAPPN